MSEQKVNIENLTIRLPRHYKDKAQDIGQDIASNLSAKLPRHFRSNRYDSLNFRVNISNEAIPSQITTLITEAILKGLV
ncbi:MAG: hypothetical protein H8D45_13390 [Bacteroidetes bacterium]|nr:hypothetical protein [Bacteroidota bacterium]MBL7103302.1 hypothetical protein [Bacteroidales bacterium]